MRRKWSTLALVFGTSFAGLLVVGVVAFLGTAIVAAALDSAATPPVNESIATGDTVGTVSGASSTVSEKVTPSDALTTVAGRSSSTSEDIVPSDNVNLVAGASRTVGESVGTHDAVTLTPVNTPPRLVLPGQLQANEGSTLTGTGSFVDPDPNQQWTATVNWGDGTAVAPLVLASDKTFALSHLYDDNAPNGYTLTVTLSDGIATTTGSIHVDIADVAPTATLGNSGPVAEGSPATVSFANASDPSAADTAAGFHYQFACDGATLGVASSSPTTTCTFDDGPSTHTVKGRISDKDGGFTDYTTTVVVSDVAPTATFGNSGPVAEGSPATVSFTNASDPSEADIAAGFSYQFACDGATLGAASSSPTTTCTFDDGPSTHTVKGRITDKDGGFTEYTTTVTVNNVAPTATFTAPNVDEGSPIVLTLSGGNDPSTADTAAGFTYAFDCGDGAGLGAFGSANSASCPTNDNGTRAVQGAVRDKDGGTTFYGATATVRNVAPVAAFVTPGSSVPEGQTFTIALTNPHDPSTVDTTAGFMYAFDCGAGYATASPAASAVCPAVNDPGADVKAKISDKDGGTTEYTAHVTITNVAPAVQILTPPASSAYPVGTMVSLTGSFTDPGVKDTHTAQWNFDALKSPGAVAESNGSGTVAGTFTFTAPGVYSVTLTLTDSSGGTGTASTVGGKPELIVVFDPSHGVCAGAGWVSAGGTAKTTFAFAAKYVNGSLLGATASITLPNGKLFAAVKMQWMVISGGRCQLRGEGTLGGQTGYSFLLTAQPAPGAFRIKIWRTSDGSVVYDNVPGASDDIDLAAPQPLGAGAITIS